ncbi:MAG: 3-dehydroquinate synthase family protein [Coxiellaceae bacterium]|nr:3-dehydroquinate synthase family protein [Coxiellaceae bacterium]
MSSGLTKFSIEKKDFFYDIDLFNQDKFIIKSIPRNYLLSFDVNENPFCHVKELLAENKKNLLLIDQKLLEIYKPTIDISADRIFSVQATEDFKTLEGVTNVLNFLQKHEFTKGEKLIVVGGGIIQDVAAFVGAVYKRGISWVHFPTTLLSMCDSCIGGKAGVNYNGVKNQLALFSAPSAIHINLNFLKTLSENEINSGLGEILKLCITGGDTFIKIYRENVCSGKVALFENFKKLITAALCVKKSVVEEDEFELDHRRSMNYGHTLGHAIESLSNYQIPHGQAVVVGMILVNTLSYEQGLLTETQLHSLNELCCDLISNNVIEALKKIKLEEIIGLIKKDKKTIGDNTSFVLMKNSGETVFVKLKLDGKLLSRIQSAFDSLLNIV